MLDSEAYLQEQLVNRLKANDWFVKVIVGNAVQFGLPDVYAAHPMFGAKWIEMKNPKGYSFTQAQQETFPKLHAAGVGIWILFGYDDAELKKLTQPANWFEPYFEWVSKRRGHI